MKRCNDCREGEHENYDNNVCLTVVRCPETGKVYKRAYLCEEHRVAYRDDGYRVEEVC
jgi:hypothetical protein